MKNKTNFIFSSILFLSIVLFSSCKKDEPVDSDIQGAIDAAYAETIFGDAAAISDEAGYKSGPFNGILSSSCVNVSWDTINSIDEDTITIDFGTTNCTCIDSASRKGKLIITYLGNYGDSAVSHKITFSNYYINNDRLNGSYTIVNNGHDSISGHSLFTANSLGSITLSNGSQLNWTSVKHIVWYSGEGTSSISDDVFYITGDASGNESAGRPFLSQISTSLVRNLSSVCRKNFSQGIIQVKPNEKSMRVLDFGSGCDNYATITIDGVVYQAVLR